MPSEQHPSQHPTTVIEELSLFVRRIPSWLFVLVSLLGIFVLYQFVGGVLTLLLFGINLSAGDVTGFRIATMAAQIVFLLIPTIVLARLRFPNVPNVFRFGRLHPSHLVVTIVAVLALQQLLQTYLLMQEAVPVEFPPFIRDLIDRIKEMMEQMYRTLTTAQSFGEFLFVVFVIAVTPAVCEEMLFRGLIQRALEEPSERQIASAAERQKRGWIAAVIAGVIFGLYHLNPFTLVPLIALGVYFGFVVYRTRNITPAIVAHFVNNFLACLAVYLHLDENFIAVSPTESPTVTMIILNAVWSAVVFVAATCYLVRSTSSLHQSQASTDDPPSKPISA